MVWLRTPCGTQAWPAVTTSFAVVFLLAPAFARLHASDAPVLFAPAAGVAAELLAARGAHAEALAYANVALLAAERASRPSELARARARCAALSA